MDDPAVVVFTVKVTTPEVSEAPEGAEMLSAAPRLEEIATVLPGTGLPLASLSVTVMVAVVVPSATAEEDEAVTVETEALVTRGGGSEAFCPPQAEARATMEEQASQNFDRVIIVAVSSTLGGGERIGSGGDGEPVPMLECVHGLLHNLPRSMPPLHRTPSRDAASHSTRGAAPMRNCPAVSCHPVQQRGPPSRGPRCVSPLPRSPLITGSTSWPCRRSAP